jgi:hypothetical protein
MKDSKRDVTYTIRVHGCTRAQHEAIYRAAMALAETIGTSGAVDGATLDIHVGPERTTRATIIDAIRAVIENDPVPPSSGVRTPDRGSSN